MRNFTISNYQNTRLGSYGNLMKGLLLCMAVVLFQFSYAQNSSAVQTTFTVGTEPDGQFANGFDPENYTPPKNSFSMAKNLIPSLPNPGLASNQTCANLRVAFVLDESRSIITRNGVEQVKEAALGLAEAFQGSPAFISIIEFDEQARVVDLGTNFVNSTFISNLEDYLYDDFNGQNYAPAPVAGSGCLNGYTNWEDALLSVDSDINLVIFVTDGDPTAYNTNNACGYTLGSGDDFLNPAIEAANVLKDENGTHIFGIGVGDYIFESNLQAITGPSNFALGGDIWNTDYLIGSFADLKDNLTAGLNAICGTELAIDKSVNFDQVCDDETITFTITVENTGGIYNYTAADIVVTDTFPSDFENLAILGNVSGASLTGQILTYTIESLPAGESVTIQLTADLGSASTGVYTNVAHANAVNANKVQDDASVEKTDVITLYETVTACESFEWNGVTYYESDTYVYEGENENGCPTHETLVLIITTPDSSEVEVEACGSWTWERTGQEFTQSFSGDVVFEGENGECDEIVTLTVNIVPAYDIVELCADSPYIFPYTLEEYSEAGIYDIQINEALCVKLYLGFGEGGACALPGDVDGAMTGVINDDCECIPTVGCEPTSGIDVQEACDSFVWIDGATYTADNNSATHTLTNVAGCDSVVTLNLTINQSTTGVDTQEACDSFVWIDGITYDADNNSATHILTNAAGCDSVVTLNLTIHQSTTGVDTQEACDSFVWIDGITYDADNNSATHILTNAVGCDSVVTLNLTINSGTHEVFNEIACQGFDWNGTNYSESGTYYYNYQNNNGCASADTLHLVIEDCNVVDNCEFVYFLANQALNATNSDIYGVTISGGIATLHFIASSEDEVHIAYHEEQKLIYAVSKHNNSYRTLDPATQAWGPVVPLNKNMGQITAAVFNSDGKLLLGSQNQKVIYSVNEANAVSVYDTYAPVNGGDLAFGSDGMLYMATRSGNGLYQVWPAPAPDNLLGHLPAKVTGMAITGENQLLISAVGNSSLVITNTDGTDPGISYNLMLNGEPFTLGSGDMASGCNPQDTTVEGCDNYKLYYVHQPQGVSTHPLLEVTLNNDGTASHSTVIPHLGGHIGITPDGTTIYSVVGNKLKTVDIASASVISTVTIKNTSGTTLSNFPAVVVSQDGTIYAGRINKVYTIDPNTGVATQYGPNRTVSGGDLIEMDGEIWVITRNNNKFTNVLTGASFTVPVTQMNGAAVLENGMVLVADGNGGSLLKVIDPATQEVVGTYDIGLPLHNGDLAGVCVGGDPDVTIPGTCYASVLVEHVMGTTKSNGAIGPDRNDPSKALGAPERTDAYVFLSLGYGGSITLGFDGAIINGPGADIEVVETSFGSPSCNAYREYADVSVSVNGTDWHSAGTICRTNGFIDLDDVEGGALDYVYFVKIANNNTESTSPDGFDLDGVVAIHNCIDEDNEVPPTNPFIAFDSNSVLSAYPNPTKGNSKVVFTTGQTTRALVEVYDMNGRNVATLFNQEAQQGKEYTVDFNGSNLPNGVYIYRMTTDNETIVEKFMIAK